MTKLITLVLLIYFTPLVHGQDIIYTINYEKDGTNTNLDSILFENLTNDSRITFGALPEQDYYVVNLSSQEIEINTDLIDFVDKGQMFELIKNIPGEISIKNKFGVPGDIYLSVVDLNGQKLYNQKIDRNLLFGTIDIKIPNPGFYIINLHSPLGSQSFKVTGAGRSGMISLKTSIGKPETHGLPAKSALLKSEPSFSFQEGDSVRVIAYSDGNSTYPFTFTVSGSDTLNLFFVEPDENYLIVNNTKYALNLGHHVWGNANDCGAHDGSSIYSHGLYLTSGIYLNKIVDEGSSLLPYGKGNMVVFNMLNRDSLLVSGQYTFINGVDCYGLVSIGDSTFTMDATDKFVTTKEKNDPTHYAFNVDLDLDWNTVNLNDPSEEVINKWTNYQNAIIDIVGGSVTVEKNDDLFIVTIDCIDSNGLRVTGRFLGQLNWILFDV